MATLVVRNPDGTEAEHELVDEMIVGRADGSGLVLTEGGVSRKHARLWVEDGRVLVEDTGSANGTFIDGERLGAPSEVPPGAQLRIGAYELSVKPAAKKPIRGGAAGRPPSRDAPKDAPRGPSTRAIPRVAQPKNPNAPPQRKPSQAAGGGAGTGGAIEKRAPGRVARAEDVAPLEGQVLRGLTGPWANKRFPLEGTLVIGRSPGVQVLIDDDSVSRRHAEVAPTEEGVVLRDLGSANGTLLNGEPVTEDVLVSPGDIIQVGVVELVLEDAAMANVPRRGGKTPSRAAPEQSRSPVGAVLGLLLLLGGGGFVAFKLTSGGGGGGGDAQHGPPGEARPLVDGQTQVTELLSQCRSFSSGDGGDPDWNKAEAACNKALDLDPINEEANTLIKRIKFEQENFEHYSKAEKAMARLQEEEALEEFSKIRNGSQYYLKVKPRLKDAVAGLLRATSTDCKRYMREGEWQAAYDRCEKYMLFACPNMPRDEVVPPPGYTIRLSGGKPRKNEWAPKDPMLKLFLQARQRKDPKLPVWECPPNDLLRDGGTAKVDVDREVMDALKKLYPEKEFVEALFLYWKGRPNEAVVKLQKVRETSAKAELHAQADELRKGMTQVAALFKAGETELQQDDAIKAAEPFGEALGIDEKLMKDLAKNRPSYFRRGIQVELSAGAYKNGRFWADRQDHRRACRIWKVGFDYYKGNVDLSKAILFCSTKAQEMFRGAESCDDIAKALELAVDGDGLKEKAEGRKAELKCR
ncbi:MAG TPA: FHA domain-containing protein [Myxococcaceae bacterium]|nr:FHA domain-containing protein [Myxococcaceae bacterium]